MSIKWVASLIFASLHGLLADAGDISVYPTTLVLDEKSQISSLKIRNDGDSDGTYELAGYRWTQKDGADVLYLDQSFVVSPPVVVLRPGEERIVRVGLVDKDYSGPDERSYRLRISELPDSDTPDIANLNVRLQIILPVFDPGAHDDLQLDFSAVRSGNDGVCIHAINQGETHVKLIWIAPAGSEGRQMPVQKYILAKAQGDLCVEDIPGINKSVLVGVTSAYQTAVHPYEIALADP